MIEAEGLHLRIGRANDLQAIDVGEGLDLVVDVWRLRESTNHEDILAHVSESPEKHAEQILTHETYLDLDLATATSLLHLLLQQFVRTAQRELEHLLHVIAVLVS